MKYLKEQFKMLEIYEPMANNVTGIFLNANEAFYDTPYEIKKHISEYVLSHNINRYPDDSCENLKNSIAKKYGVLPQNIAVGVGSDEILDILLRSSASNKNVLSLDPSFSMYPIFTMMNEGNFIKIPLNDDFSFDLNRTIEAIKKEKPIVTLICNPNNPTGTTIDVASIEEIAKLNIGILVIDEAYEDFSNNSSINFIKKYDNICIIRTFSKAYALASIRLGYAIANEDIIKMLDTVRAPYTMNTLSQEIASYAISHFHLYKDKISEVIENREYLYEQLKNLNIIVYPSKTNFLFMYLNDKIKNKMIENNIHLRYFGKYTRVTVGNKEENEAFLNVIRENL
ncbi:MAG: histidinol-phosphate transaminase [Fusobacteriaceae bacterium]|jgi:histidinol-phosphate aminotransferase|nr:histidinol-phosphate transaminase [Fusobacteriaceae bacterium]